MTAARGRWRALRPLAILLVVGAAVPWVVSLSGVDDRRDRTHVVRSYYSNRKLDLKWERDYQYEATFEKCDIQQIDVLASGLGVPPDPTAVARAYSLRHEPSIRQVVFQGCRDALIGRWSPPHQPGGPSPAPRKQ
ncbi:MAG: hypothetical protein QOF37_2673 [Thermoleophilaceae bacterium]|nr:hypothetical protein [Thermoleophilaceae bacterium]